MNEIQNRVTIPEAIATILLVIALYFGVRELWESYWDMVRSRQEDKRLNRKFDSAETVYSEGNLISVTLDMCKLVVLLVLIIISDFRPTVRGTPPGTSVSFSSYSNIVTLSIILVILFIMMRAYSRHRTRIAVIRQIQQERDELLQHRDALGC